MWTHWLKWLIVIDVDTQALLTQEARRGPYNDSATLRPMIESVFSATKRKLSTRAPGRSLFMQRRQAFLLGLTFNLYRLRCRPRRSSTDFILRMSTEPGRLMFRPTHFVLGAIIVTALATSSIAAQAPY
jgi:hypothetical protein